MPPVRYPVSPRTRPTHWDRAAESQQLGNRPESAFDVYPLRLTHCLSEQRFQAVSDRLDAVANFDSVRIFWKCSPLLKSATTTCWSDGDSIAPLLLDTIPSARQGTLSHEPAAYKYRSDYSSHHYSRANPNHHFALLSLRSPNSGRVKPPFSKQQHR
jgi:hypothetical protein